MAGPLVLGFVIDDENTEKLGHHGITEFQMLQVLEDQFYIGRNKRRRRATYLVIGYDYGGACLTIPIAPTRQATIWRPVTGWYSTPAEQARRDRYGDRS